MSLFGLNAGDILLVNNKTRGNIFGQKVLRLKKSVNTTHIALSLGDGGFIHADKSCGVDLIFFNDLINKAEGDWKVIRHCDAQKNTEEQIKKIAMFHLYKTYNKGIILRENEKSLFCSQFVEVVFRNLGINIFNRVIDEKLITFSNALPVDFESLILEIDKWSDVSKIYQEKLEDNIIKNNLETISSSNMILINIERNQQNQLSSLSNTLNYLKDSHKQLTADFQSEKLDGIISENIRDLESLEDDFFYDFWDARSKRR